MPKHFLSSDDPIRILNFLAKFVREEDIQEMSDAQVFIALSFFLTESAQSHCEARVEKTPLEEDGVSCLSEDVKDVLRHYAQSNIIINDISDMKDLHQKARKGKTSSLRDLQMELADVETFMTQKNSSSRS